MPIELRYVTFFSSVCLGTLVLLAPRPAFSAAIDEIDPPLSPQHYEPMPDEIRAAVKELVVLPSDVATDEGITGTYDEAQSGLIAGADEGRNMGTMNTEVGPVNVRIPIPILQLPGMVYGGLSGAAKKDIQEFRDALTEDLASADSQPLENHALALDVHRNIWSLASVNARLFASPENLPDATDAVLYVGFGGFRIDVQKSKATLFLTAKAVLARQSDNAILYTRVIEYQDTDTLSNWVKDDLALWHNYSNFAAHYLARELAGEAFYRQVVPNSIVPVPTATAKADRKVENRYTSKSLTPELAWEHTIHDKDLDGNPVEPVDPASVAYAVEIYDSRRLVYKGQQTAGTSHVVGLELEPCQTYRWSVRPAYTIGDNVTYGDWMRLATDEAGEFKGRNGLVGRNASTAPAYTQDFPELEIKCGRRK